MAIVNFVERHDAIREEAKIAWNWLKKGAEYKADYERQEKLKDNISLENQEELRIKYGFYPLIDPKAKLPHLNAPWDFFLAFGKLLGNNPTERSVDFKNLNSLDVDAYENPEYWKKYKFKGRGLPEKILLEIDPNSPINDIVYEIKFFLKRVKTVYKIKDTRTRVDKLSGIYKAYVLKKIGIKNKEVLKIIEPLIEDDKLSKSRIKRGKRMVGKAKLIGPNKS